MVNHALDFDLSVLPGSYTGFYASQVNAADAWHEEQANDCNSARMTIELCTMGLMLG